MIEKDKVINELRFQLNSKEVKEQHYPVQLSASDAEKIIALLKEQEERIKLLEHQLEALTKWRMNAGAFD